ncbi:hypothetical protein [Nonomuraea dietziae]|uniref:hypothetical protein n=1 Tax=Nonomuraea dietziae TaxID=65515 RepID=UPI0033E30171
MRLASPGFRLIVFVSETVGWRVVSDASGVEPEELIAAWTLLDDDWELVGNKTGATRWSYPTHGT